MTASRAQAISRYGYAAVYPHSTERPRPMTLPSTLDEAIPPRWRTPLYVAALLAALVLVGLERSTGVDALDMVARFAVVLGAILAVAYRPTRGA